MKKSSVIIIFSAVFTTNCFSQIKFQQYFHKDSLLFSVSFAEITYDNGFVIAGTVAVWQLFGSGDGDIFIFRTDSTGVIQWERRWDLANDEEVFSVTSTPDTGYIITGFTFGATTNSRDGFILKADDNGNMSFVKRIDHNGESNTFHSVRKARNNHFIYSGRDGGGAGGQYDMHLSLADSAGNIIWGKTFGGNDWDWGWWAEETSDYGFIMTGESQSFLIGSNDIYLVKTDSIGNKLWSRVYGSATFEKGLWVKEMNGAYYVAGYTQGFVSGNTDAKTFLMKTDLSGNVLWMKIYLEMSSPAGILATNDGGIILVGSSYNLPGGFGITDMFIIKADSAGNIQWARNYGGSGSDAGATAQELADGFLFGGVTYSFITGPYSSSYLIKADTNVNSGCHEIPYTITVYNASPAVVIPADAVSSGYTSYVPVSTNIPLTLVRDVLCYYPPPVSTEEIAGDANTVSVYPNPSSNTVSFSLPAYSENDFLIIYDVSGRIIYRQKIKNVATSINVSLFQPGLYFYNTTGSENILNGKFVVK